MKNDDEKIYRMKDLVKYLNLSRSLIYLILKEGSPYFRKDFPKPISLSKRAKGWRKAAVDEYLLKQEQLNVTQK